MIDRMVLACSVALLGAMTPLRAFAEPPPTSTAPLLTWDATDSCPSGDLLGSLSRSLGVRREHLGSKLLRVDVMARPAPRGGWQTRLEIETTAGSGERTFWAEDCPTLVDGVTVILALTIDPSSVPPRSRSGAAFAGLATGPSAKTTLRRPRFLLRPLLAADVGILPDVALAYGLAAGVAWPSLRLEVGDWYQSPQTISDGRGHSGQASIPIDSHARICATPWRWNSVEPGACLGTSLAWLRTTGGSDLAVAETHDTLSVALSAGAAVGLRLRDWLWLRAEAHLGFMVRRPNLQVVGASQSAFDVYRAPWLTFRIGGGLELRL
jgi:hypothetical protein